MLIPAAATSAAPDRDRAREGSGGGVAVATPPPEPRVETEHRHPPARVDRIHSALREARSLLEAGDLDSALEAGEKALALDDTNPEALEVERAIRAAAVRRRTRALLSEVRSLMRRDALEEAQQRLEQARGLNAELAECALVESELQAHRAAFERRSRDQAGPREAIPRDMASSPVD